jgi:hypothetical protein
MFRRSTVLAAVAACALAGMPGAHAAFPTTGNPAPAEMPRANCSHRLIDPENDAKWPAQAGTQAQPVDGTDINGVLLRLTPEQLQVFVSLKKLSAPGSMPLTASAFAYEVTFKYGTTGFYFGLMENNTQAPWSAAPTASTSYPRANTGATLSTEMAGATADMYVDKNYVVWTVARSSIETAVGGPIADGDQFTNVTAQTLHFVGSTKSTDDSLDVTAANAKFTVGDDYCFGAPPATLSDLVAPTAVYTDPVTLSAKLVNEAGAPVAGKPVQFTVAGEAPLTGTTGDDGIAKVTYVPTKVGAGTYAVNVLFPGDAEVGKAKLTGGTIVVTTETAVFGALKVAKPSATTRTVTATLLDNDKRPIAGQKVDWYVNGKKVATYVTNSKGQSVYKAAKPTQTVLAKFAGVAGKYTAAAAKAVKV